MADSEHELWYETVSEEQINKNIDNEDILIFLIEDHQPSPAISAYHREITILAPPFKL